MIGLIISTVIAILFLVASIFLFNGKGSYLIAGYNTASPEEKAKFDERKICKVVGTVLLVVSLLVFALGFFAYLFETAAITESTLLIFTGIFVVVIIATAIFAVFYANTKCKK